MAGRLLVAAPGLVDSNFDRTVVLILEHTSDGALGVVLNRRTHVDVAGPLPDWAPIASHPRELFVGGPVQQDAVLGLAIAEDEEASDGWAPILGRLGTVDLARPPAEVRAVIRHLRIFTGYAGWAPGQLEDEISGGAWIVTTSEPGDPFVAEPDHLWTAVLRRQQARGLRESAPRHPWLN